MSTRTERIKVFQDTMNWIDSDKDLTNAVAASKKKTEVVYEDDYPEFDASVLKDTEITVTFHRTYEAAMLLRKEHPDARIAVMNFANAFHPGGGVANGAGAQEECLCRCSTLFPLLYRRTLRDTFYEYHNKRNSAKASDSLIYTEDVVICKTDENLPKRMKKEDWVKVDVITIAAPDLRSKSNIHFELVGNGAYMNDAELFGYHIKRAIHMLTVAAAKKVDILVLGAFGCGAFENNPEVVARAYKMALQEFPKVFEKVEFAVYCSPNSDKNYEVFRSVFEPEKGPSELFWFEENRAGNVMLLKPDGTRKIETDRFEDMNEFWNRGRQRALLYASEKKIWDATGFGAAMDCMIGFMVKEEYKYEVDVKAFIATTPQYVERYLLEDYKEYFDDRLIQWMRKNSDHFYSDREAQLRWQEYILYGCFLIVDEFGDVLPMDFTEFNLSDKDLYKYEIRTCVNLARFKEAAEKILI